MPASALDAAPLPSLKPRSGPRIPDGLLLYAIGDIHGRLDLLGRLHQIIRQDADGRGARDRVIVYLGDYVDRGPDSAGVIDLLIEPPLPGFRRIALRGNHEAFLLRFLEDPSVGADWLFYGGIETVASYGVEFSADLASLRQHLLRALPATHRRFLEGLALMHEEGDYAFVHAGVRPGIPLAWQSDEDLVWIRSDFLNSPCIHEKIIVHGHSITRSPEVMPNRIGIDTGAFMTGQLTSLVLEGNSRRFLTT